jgi:hypothetical protein
MYLCILPILDDIFETWECSWLNLAETANDLSKYVHGKHLAFDILKKRKVNASVSLNDYK